MCEPIGKSHEAFTTLLKNIVILKNDLIKIGISESIIINETTFVFSAIFT